MLLDTVEKLEAHYGAAKERSLWKELDHLSDQYRAFVEAAPFCVLATAGPEGLDTSPRGDPGGAWLVPDPKTVLIPDRPGNNRIDSLRKIVRDPRVALIFLVPGVGETMRVNGRARISVAPGLLERCAMEGRLPRAVIEVTVEAAYFQCSKALVRSRLWDPDARVDRASLPSAGDMVATTSPEPFDAATYDAEYPERMKRQLY